MTGWCRSQRSWRIRSPNTGLSGFANCRTEGYGGRNNVHQAETTRGAVAPQEVVACSFLFSLGLLFLLCARPARHCLGASPKGGAKSKRIALNAVLLTLGSNQFRHCSIAVFIVLGLVAGKSRNDTSSKESVSYASCRLVLVMREPIHVVFIMGLRFFLFLYRRYCRCCANF